MSHLLRWSQSETQTVFFSLFLKAAVLSPGCEDVGVIFIMNTANTVCKRSAFLSSVQTCSFIFGLRDLKERGT